jgi:hypothetical protein
MPLPPLIGLYSPAPQSGKTTIAEALVARGWQRVRFAGPLKAMLATMLAEVGEDRETISRMIEGDLKELAADALAGETPRWAMQTLGTEWGRKLIHPDIWVRLFLRRAVQLRRQGYPVVCDDLRFCNEAAAIRAAGGRLVRIERPGSGWKDGHASEGALEGETFAIRLRNDQPSAAAFAAAAMPMLLGAEAAREAA